MNREKQKAIEEGLSDFEEETKLQIEEILDICHVMDVNDEDGLYEHLLKINGFTQKDVERYFK